MIRSRRLGRLAAAMACLAVTGLVAATTAGGNPVDATSGTRAPGPVQWGPTGSSMAGHRHDVSASSLAADFSPPARVGGWNFDVTDATANEELGPDSSATVYQNQPHVFYHDHGFDKLKHAWFDGRWHKEISDGTGGAGGRSTEGEGHYSNTIIYQNQPHVFYLQNWCDPNKTSPLRHAWWDGTRWHYESLDGVNVGGGRIAATICGPISVVPFNGQPHIFYSALEPGTGHSYLRHAWYTGRWNYETLDGGGGIRGRTTDNIEQATGAQLFGGLPHVWYFDADTHDLRHAWWTGSAWHFQTLDGVPGLYGQTTDDLGFYLTSRIYNGTPNIWYQDRTNWDLRHAWWDGANWDYETLDGNGTTLGRTDAEVGSHLGSAIYNGQPHIFYVADGSGQEWVRHAWWDGTRWRFEDMNGKPSSVGGQTFGDLAGDVTTLVYNNQLHVWYEGDEALRHMWYTP